MNGFDWPLSLGMARVSSTFLVNWVSQLQCIVIWQERNARIFADVSDASNLVFDQTECIIRGKLVSKHKDPKTFGGSTTWPLNLMFSWLFLYP